MRRGLRLSTDTLSITHGLCVVKPFSADFMSLVKCTKQAPSHYAKRIICEVLYMETIFWQRLKKLCAENGTTPTGVCKATGLSTGSPPAWKRGSIPIQAVREKIAEYFGVSPEYFLEEQKTPSGANTDALTEDELLAFALFGSDYKSISVEKLAEIRRYAEFIKNK